MRDKIVQKFNEVARERGGDRGVLSALLAVGDILEEVLAPEKEAPKKKSSVFSKKKG